MITFLVGLVTGGFIGIAVAALCVAAGTPAPDPHTTSERRP